MPSEHLPHILGDYVALTASGSVDRDPHIVAMLGRLRAALHMDVAFVSQFVSGKRVIRYISAEADDEYGQIQSAVDPEEESYCGKVVNGTLPPVIRDTALFPEAMAIPATEQCHIRSHISAPVIGEDGRVFGTVCCFSHRVMDELGKGEELETLRSIAGLLADVLSEEAG